MRECVIIQNTFHTVYRRIKRLIAKLTKLLPKQDSDSGSEADSESEPDLMNSQDVLKKYLNKIAGQDGLLTDGFIALYGKFDEDDIEAYYDLRKFLEVLNTRGCIDEDEYKRIKLRLEEKMKVNLQQTIDTVVENMTVLKLFEKMKKVPWPKDGSV